MMNILADTRIRRFRHAPRSIGAALVGGALLALGIVHGVTAGELAKWDQERVTAIAEKLEPATDKLYETFYKQRIGGARTGGENAHQFKDRIRLLHLESKHFVGALKKGEGHDETRTVYLRIKELNDDAAMYGRRTFELNPTIGSFAEVEDLLRQLAPYYDKDWDSAGDH